MRSLQHSLSGVLCALLVAAGACSEEGPTTLFAEQGTWALFQYDLDGTGIFPLDQDRVDKFLIYFDSEAKIVAAAECVDSMGRTDVDSALCDIDEFQCRCFEYLYEESKMVWTEFSPEGAATPPEPPEDSDAAPVGTPFTINLEAYPNSMGTYRYSGMPYGLFTSDGVSSRYVFQVRGDVKFIPTGCLEICGATSPEQEPPVM